MTSDTEEFSYFFEHEGRIVGFPSPIVLEVGYTIIHAGEKLKIARIGEREAMIAHSDGEEKYGRYLTFTRAFN